MLTGCSTVVLTNLSTGDGDAGFYDLRGYAKLKPPAVRTTRFGLHSFLHLAPNAWNKLPDTTRKADTLSMFKHKLKQFKT